MTKLASPVEVDGQSQRLKLLLVTVGLGVGGTEGQIGEIATRLDPRRLDVCVCALKGSDVIAHELRQRGVRVIALDGKGTWDLRVLYRLYRLVRDERPHIIHAFLFWANFASRVVGRALSVPIMISSYRDSPLWTRWYERIGDRLTSHWVHAVTCCSDAVRQLALVQLGGNPGRYFTIHNGVDLKLISAPNTVRKREVGLRENVPVVGTICRLLEPKKGLTTLLQAMAKLTVSSRSSPVQLLIVGDGPSLGQLLSLSERLGIAQWVHFVGMRRDISSMLSLIDIFVLPSLYEGFGIAIVEAMAAGRPVVATAVGGIPEIVVQGETGLLVPPGDPAALASAIDTLLRDATKAKALGKRGQQEARRRFTIESVVEEHMKLYDTLAASRALVPTNHKMSLRDNRGGMLASGEAQGK